MRSKDLKLIDSFREKLVKELYLRCFFIIVGNGLVYDFDACLSTKLANKSQIESPRGLS